MRLTLLVVMALVGTIFQGSQITAAQSVARGSSNSFEQPAAADNETSQARLKKVDAPADFGPSTRSPQMIDRIIAREREEVSEIKKQRPIVETYIQEVKLDGDFGTIPQHDHFYMGQARLDKDTEIDSMLPRYDGLPMKGFLKGTFIGSGFLRMIFVDSDMSKFNRQNYKFEYVTREFLGEVRCLIFDVTPLPRTGHGRFRGRIWVEDQDYTIVRFNGSFTPIGDRGFSPTINSHFDSYRANVQPKLWLPDHIYEQELNQAHGFGQHERFKAITSLWGYQASASREQTEFTDIAIEQGSEVEVDAPKNDRSPVEEKRLWDSEAEKNVTEGMERAGILTKPGPYDAILNTVLNNIAVDNNIDPDLHLHCRVATFDSIEMFTVGPMIVLSKGLVDVLPNEETLAVMVAQGMADAMTPNPLTEQYGFGDYARVATVEALSRYSFKERQQDIQAANDRALKMLHNSTVYRDKLGSASLFLQQLNSESKALNALISPRLGQSVYLGSALTKSGDVLLKPKDLEQVAALPLGSRLKMNPWDDSIQKLSTKPVPLMSAREKMPFEVTPLMPYLTRYKASDGPSDRSHPAAGTQNVSPSKPAAGSAGVPTPLTN